MQLNNASSDISLKAKVGDEFPQRRLVAPPMVSKELIGNVCPYAFYMLVPVTLTGFDFKLIGHITSILVSDIAHQGYVNIRHDV